MRGPVAILLVGLLWAWTLPAEAFLLVATDEGVPTRWHQQCIPWKMNALGSDDISVDEAHGVITSAFTAWSQVEESYIRFEDQGTTDVDFVSLSQGVGENIVLWHEEGEWPYALHVVGLTSLTYDTDTGQIMDADIEMNGDDYDFATDGSPDAYDAEQSLVHEVGHLLGLDHSADEDAVMFAESQPGENHKRSPQPDDIAGLLFSHPVSARPETDGCVAPTFVAEPEPRGCASGGSSGLIPALLLLGSFGVWRRRRGGETSLAALLIAGTITATIAAEARAGTPYTTDDGTPIFWPQDSMFYTLHPDVPEGLTPASVEVAIGRAFDAWEPLECQPLTLDLAGWDSCPGEDPDDGINCIRWRDREELWAWPDHMVAVTLVHYWEDSGVIEDVDMDINAFNTSWSTDLECDPDLHDLVATITHEAGHFLGLDHSQDGQATMNSATTTGDCQKRSLELDDVETYCGTYDNRPDLVEPAGSDIAVIELDAQGNPDGGDDFPPPGSREPRGLCAGSSAGGWLSVYGVIAWLLATRQARRGLRRARAH